MFYFLNSLSSQNLYPISADLFYEEKKLKDFEGLINTTF